jgi:hypothetical protein
MKRPARFWVLICLAMISAGWFSSRFITLLLLAPATAQTSMVAVSLPNTAIVKLTDGRTNSGKVVAINAQTLTLQRGNDKLDIPLNQVAQTNGGTNIEFDRSGPFHEVNTGRQLMRIRSGSDPVAFAVGSANELGPVGWPQFRIVDPSKGYVEIDLPPSSSFRTPAGATSVADLIRVSNQVSVQVTPWQAQDRASGLR